MQLLISLICLCLCYGSHVPNDPKENGLSIDNNRILFVTNSESGLGNVALAVSHALLLNYPSLELHLASFPKFEEPAKVISRHAREQSVAAQAIRFHTLPGPTVSEALSSQGFDMDNSVNAPGLTGQTHFLNNLESFLLSWSGPEYVVLYRAIEKKVEEIDPAIVVIDTVLAPATDAVRNMGRKHIMLSANSLKDHFSLQQPYGSGFWKYPALNSGFTFPVPWHQIPANIILNIRLVYSVLRTPTLAAKIDYIASQGLRRPANILQSYRSDVPWLSPALPEYEYPMTLPANVTLCGPIYLSTVPVVERDPELAAWLAKAPTVLINLGSLFTYNETDSIEMVTALQRVLRSTDVQVLWKMNKRHPYESDYLRPIEEYVQAGRVKVQTWITADPPALLESGHIVLSIHHGGANCFHEALATGVPTMVPPIWADLYDYAARTEWLGLGIWANKKTAPRWTADELTAAFSRALGDGEEARRLRDNAKRFKNIAQVESGREVAAHKIVEHMLNKTGDAEPSQSAKSEHKEL